MFLDFFYLLRSKKIPVTPTEYQDLLKVLDHYSQGSKQLDVQTFYQLARHCMVKDVRFFDSFDQAYAQMFGGLISGDDEFKKKLQDWLEKAINQNLSDERKANALKILPEDMMAELEKRFKEQKERHDGGNKWIGTGGTSPFGHSGFNPQGIRIGGNGSNKSAMVVAGKRNYTDYRTDETLNLRQIKMALKELRVLGQYGRPQISISKSIKKTCDQAGEIEIVYEKQRKNSLKVLLLMDIGGSMTPYARQVGQLFSAAHQVNHFKEFKAYYFHNIFYDHLYFNHYLSENDSITIPKLYQKYNKDLRVIIVGDASMAPYELFQMNGQTRFYYDYFSRGKYSVEKSPTAIERVMEFKEHFPKTVWLNPESPTSWSGITISAVKKSIPMYHLSLDGLKKAIEDLIL